MANEKTVKRIEIQVSGTGADQLSTLAKGMGQLNKKTKDLSNGFGDLTRGILGFSVFGFGVREVVNLSDSMQGLRNRLTLITEGTEEAGKVLVALGALANKTNTDVESLAKIFTSFGIALKNTGISSGLLLQTTELLQNSYRLSGSTVEETTGSLLQLSQAFSRGALRGQELNSILSGNKIIATALRNEYGKDLFKKAEQGAITTAEVFRILFKNAEEINRQALTLAPTFQQSLAKAFNSFKIAVEDVNRTFNISSNFGKMIDYLINNLPLVGSLITVLALTQIPNLARSMAAFFSFAVAGNPYVAVFAAIAGTILILTDRFYGLEKAALKVYVALATVGSITQAINSEISQVFEDFGIDFGTSSKEYNANVRNLTSTIREAKKEIDSIGVRKPVDPLDAFKVSSEEQQKYLADLRKQFGETKEKADPLRKVLGELNAAFLDNRITKQQYADKLIDFNLAKVNREAREGRFAIDEYNKRLEELNRQGINRAFDDGRISLQEFNRAISESKLKDLDTDLRSGKISLSQFRVEVVKLQQDFSAGGALAAGATGYLDSIGTASQQTAGAIQNAFTGLENAFSTFIKTGKFEFAQFTQAILDDLTKIIVRASIVQPLANGLLSAFGGAGAGATGSVGGGGGQYVSPVQAKGGVWDRGIQKFASGGIVNSPTMFNHSGGKGLMGEAGPEAILPLSRGRGGNLGVQATVTPVTINVINNSSSEVKTEERQGPNGERMIEVLIANKMKDAFNSGTMDKTMQQSYGIRRKGS